VPVYLKGEWPNADQEKQQVLSSPGTSGWRGDPAPGRPQRKGREASGPPSRCLAQRSHVVLPVCHAPTGGWVERGRPGWEPRQDPLAADRSEL